MKKVRILLSTLAFTFALVSAFASYSSSKLVGPIIGPASKTIVPCDRIFDCPGGEELCKTEENEQLYWEAEENPGVCLYEAFMP